MGGVYSTHGKEDKCLQYLVGKPERKRLIGRPRRRWKDNIRMELTQIEWEGVDWMHVVQDVDLWRVLVNTLINLWVP
jgi:hypothetical protein